MKWIKCDSIEYTLGHQLNLFRTEDFQVLAFVLDVGLDQVTSLTSGPELRIFVRGMDRHFFAVRTSTWPSIEPFKIYAANDPSPIV